MSNLIEKVEELRKLEAEATAPQWDRIEIEEIFDHHRPILFNAEEHEKNSALVCGLRNASPDLLAVLALIQPGDAEILELFRQFIRHFTPNGHLTDEGPGAKITNAEAAEMFDRLAEMARLMEAP